MATRPDPERLALWNAFLAAHASITAKLAADLQTERDMTLPWFDTLSALAEAGVRLRMRELAERLGVNKSSLSRQIDRMEDDGVVERVDVAGDARGHFATITRDGRDLLRRATPFHLKGVQREFAQHLTDSDVVALQRVLTKLVPAPPA